jgi:hypothetical protein
MLNEDGLLLILVLGACGFVLLGTLELLWPTRPKHPRRKPVSAREISRRAAARVAPPPPPRESRPARVAPPPAPPREEARAEVAPAPPPTVSAAAFEPTVTFEPEIPVVERGFALLKEQRLSEVVTLAERELKTRKGETPTQDAARLWGLVGLAKQGLDDVEGARFAFEEAIATASGSERSTWEGHLVALTLAVGRRAIAGQGTASPADRVASLSSAIEWLERGLAISPNYPALREVGTAAREALWAGHEAVVNDLLQKHDVAQARHALEVVIADPECPPERRLAFCRLLDGLNSGPEPPSR